MTIEREEEEADHEAQLVCCLSIEPIIIDQKNRQLWCLTLCRQEPIHSIG